MSRFLFNRTFLALSCGIFAALGVWVSLHALVQNRTIQSHHSALLSTTLNSEKESQESLLTALLENAESLSDLFSETHFIRATLREQLSRFTNPSEGSLLCKSLESMQEAIRLSPADSSLHIHWAKIAALLPPGSTCENNPSALSLSREAFRSPDANLSALAESRLNWGRTLDPSNSANLYLAALTYRRLGEKEKALVLLREVERLNPVFSEEQQAFFFRLVQSETDLALAIPRQYPEVIAWVLHFSEHRPKDYRNWEAVFAEALTEAFSSLEAKLIENPETLNSLPKHIRTSDHLPIVSRFDALRQQLDKVLAIIYKRENNRDWAEFLERRARMQRIPVLKAHIKKDILPRETMLSQWHADQSEDVIQLSRLNTSIGYYVPEGFIPKLIVVRNASRRLERSDSSLEIRTSADNEQFEIFKLPEPIESFTVDKKETLVLPAPQNGEAYVKIRIDSQGRDSSFKNRFSLLLEVYGEQSLP